MLKGNYSLCNENFSWILILFPGLEKISHCYQFKNSSGAHPASYPMDTRGSFPADKAARAWS